MSSVSRRSLLLALVMAASFAAEFAVAKDGDSGGGSGNSGSGSSNSGSGSSNSGSDSGGDDDGDDENENDNEESDDDSENDSGRHRDDDHERAIRAVRNGKAVSLKKLKVYLADRYPGKVLDVSLRRRSGDYFYSVRILGKGNRLKVLSLDALTLKPRGS